MDSRWNPNSFDSSASKSIALCRWSCNQMGVECSGSKMCNGWKCISPVKINLHHSCLCHTIGNVLFNYSRWVGIPQTPTITGSHMNTPLHLLWHFKMTNWSEISSERLILPRRMRGQLITILLTEWEQIDLCLNVVSHISKRNSILYSNLGEEIPSSEKNQFATTCALKIVYSTLTYDSKQ